MQSVLNNQSKPLRNTRFITFQFQIQMQLRDFGILKLFAIITLSVNCLLNIGCSTSVDDWGRTEDYGYSKLVTLADKNPSPDRILGMWHQDQRWFTFDSTSSWLFSKDGSAVLRQKIDEYEGTTFPSFKWRFEGNGLWNIDHSTNQRHFAKVRLVGDTLLMETDASKGIYKRFN